MNIILNGKLRSIQDGESISDLIENLNLSDTRYAVEINELVIPRSKHSIYAINENDKIEIIKAVGGG